MNRTYSKKGISIAMMLVMILTLSALLSAFFRVNAVNAASKIKLSKTQVSLQVGRTAKISLKNAKSSKVKWGSSNKSVATVENGKISAKKEGKAIITAKYKNKNYNCTVKVIAVETALTPYQKYGQVEYDQAVQIAGYSYQYAVLYDIYSSSNEGENYVLYNLNGEYDTFSFTYGHVDNKYTDDCMLTIYLDGKLVEQYTDLNSEMMPKNITIDVSGASQMKVECRIATQWAGQCGTYALVNLNFHKDTSAAANSISNGRRVVSASTPYQTFGQVKCDQIVQMAGTTYQQTVLYDIYSSSNEGANYVLYNLNGEYNTFSFTYGHCDDKYTDDCMLTIYLDGKLVKQYTDLNSEMMPKDVTIDISGASQMKIDCRIATHWAGQCGTYALANLNFH